jgi:hypothetical protein
LAIKQRGGAEQGQHLKQGVENYLMTLSKVKVESMAKWGFLKNIINVNQFFGASGCCGNTTPDLPPTPQKIEKKIKRTPSPPKNCTPPPPK